MAWNMLGDIPAAREAELWRVGGAYGFIENARAVIELGAVDGLFGEEVRVEGEEQWRGSRTGNGGLYLPLAPRP